MIRTYLAQRARGVIAAAFVCAGFAACGGDDTTNTPTDASTDSSQPNDSSVADSSQPNDSSVVDSSQPKDSSVVDTSVVDAADSSVVDAADAADAGTCSDGIQDGDETDVDCGGSCSPCFNGQKCLKNADCKSGKCIQNFCK